MKPIKVTRNKLTGMLKTIQLRPSTEGGCIDVSWDVLLRITYGDDKYIVVKDDKYPGWSFGRFRYWLRRGRAEGYPLCCVLFFALCPHNYLTGYSSKYVVDGYVPCPIHRVRS